MYKYEIIHAIDVINKNRIKFIIKLLPDIVLIRLDQNGNTLLHIIIEKASGLRSEKESYCELINLVHLILNKNISVVLIKNYNNVTPLELAISDEQNLLGILIEHAFNYYDKQRFALMKVN